MTMGDAQGDINGLTIPISSILSTSFHSSSLMAYTARDKAYNRIGVSPVRFTLGIYASGYLWVKCICRWSSDRDLHLL